MRLDYLALLTIAIVSGCAVLIGNDVIIDKPPNISVVIAFVLSLRVIPINRLCICRATYVQCYSLLPFARR
jgi:hypothetical protein